MSIAAALAGNKDAAFAADAKAQFKPGEAATFKYKQTNAGVTIAAEPYLTSEKVKAAFGKLDPYSLGILPVLVVIRNDTDKALRVDRLQVEYGAGRNRVVAIPAKDVRYTQGPERPSSIPGPAGKIKVIRPKKNPFDAWEIEGRAFTAQMLAPRQSAFGFFYFQTPIQPGATLYVNRITEAATGNELLFFEVPMQ